MSDSHRIGFTRFRKRWWAVGAAVVLLFAGLACLDGPAARWLADSGVADRVRWTDLDDFIRDDFYETERPRPTDMMTRAYWVDAVSEFRPKRLLILPGTFGFALVVAVFVSLRHRDRWKAGALILLAGVAGLVTNVLKWTGGRIRPVKEIEPFTWHPFRGGLSGLMHQTNLSFPSGHAAFAFALATMMTLLFPRFRWFWFGWAFLVAVERVAENAHYLTDVAAAAVVGVVTAVAMARILNHITTVPSPVDHSSSAGGGTIWSQHPTHV